MTHSWSPPWAPHVEGWHTDRDEQGEAQVGGACGVCKETFKRTCASGRMRHWIATFAIQHLHKEPLAEAKKGPP